MGLGGFEGVNVTILQVSFSFSFWRERGVDEMRVLMK